MMDDLRYFFFLFFFSFFFLSFMVVVVVLARDGCLVRSWVVVTQWGWRSSEALLLQWLFKAIAQQQRYREVWGDFLIEKNR